MLFLSFFLMLGISSCRSSKQVEMEYSGTVDTEISEASASQSTDDILSLINSSSEFDISGITVDFFPPDPEHPDARAAPKSLTIENVKAKENTDATTHQMTSVQETDTVNVNLRQSSASTQYSRSDTDLLRPADWVIFFSIFAAVIILTILIILKLKRRYDSLL